MKKSELEQEIASLRKEVKLLREHKAKPEIKAKKQHATVTLDKDVKEALTKFLTQEKKDYENLSPATTVFLFALGALFGRALARSKGDH